MAIVENSPRSNQSRVGQLLGIHIAMIALATLTVLGRLYVRLTSTNRGFGGDDMAILISLTLGIAFVTVNLNQIKYGLGQHQKDLPQNTDFEKSQELFYFGEMLYYTAVGITKIAVLILYLRVIPHKTLRYIIYGTMIFVSLTVFSSVVANIFQCTPIDYAWNKRQQGTCIKQVALYYSNAGLDICQDLFIYVLPIRALYRLNLATKQRIALIAIFVVGGFVVITGILRLNSLKTAAVTMDPTWVSTPIPPPWLDRIDELQKHNVSAANWSVTEICIGILCASLIHFRPLLSLFASRWIGLQKHALTYISCSKAQRRGAQSTVERTRSQYDIELSSRSESTRQLRDENMLMSSSPSIRE